MARGVRHPGKEGRRIGEPSAEDVPSGGDDQPIVTTNQGSSDPGGTKRAQNIAPATPETAGTSRRGGNGGGGATTEAYMVTPQHRGRFVVFTLQGGTRRGP